jgi:hypothetical protein
MLNVPPMAQHNAKLQRGVVDGRSRSFFVPLYWLGPASERGAQPSCTNILYLLLRTLVYLLIYSLRPSDQRRSRCSFPY